MDRSPYCGAMPMRLSATFSRDPSGGLPALFQGRRAAFSFNTRVAIRQACDLLGLRPGDEVLAPAYNCGSELDPLLHAGLRVLLYPTNRHTNIDPAAVEAAITPRTRAIYLIHYFGFLQPATAALRALCDARGLFLIEDCALSLLSGARPAAGMAGDIAVFCFYKFFPTIGGGALVINNDRITKDAAFPQILPARMMAKPLVRAAIDMIVGAERRSAVMRTLKRTPAEPGAGATAKPGADQDMPSDYYFDPRLQKARISAVTERQIRSFDVQAAIAARRSNYRTYLVELGDMSAVMPLFPELTEDACPLSMAVLVQNRDAVAAALVRRGIAATPWWAGYNRDLDFKDQPEGRHLKDHVLALPCHHYLGHAEITHICRMLREVIPSGQNA